MNRQFLCGAAVAVSIASMMIHAPAAFAVAQRTFVSVSGSDSNPCSASQPCRSFGQALTQTVPGGDITVVTPGGYGPVTITQAVAIVNDGVGEVAVTAASGNDAITINAGPGDIVTLRGLTIVGNTVGGQGIHGVTFNSGATLNMQNCVVRGFSSAGINLLPTGSSTFNLSNIILANDGTNGVGLEPIGTATTNTGYFERIQSSGNFGLANNGTGIFVIGSFVTGGTVTATIADSVANGNSTGIFVQSASGKAATTVTIVNTRMIDNTKDGIGLSGTGATAFLSGSTISGNALNGYRIGSGAVLKSFQDNAIVDTANTGSLAPVSPQ
jgi:hypothetical protein